MSNDENKEENAGNDSANKIEGNTNMESSGNDAESIDSASSTSTPGATPQSAASRNNELKRLAVKQAVERYFHQLRIGCGKDHCDNEYCASSGKIEPMSPNEAAALSLQLLRCGAQLCVKDLENKRIDQNLSCQTTNLGLSTAHCSGSSYSTTPNDSEPSSSSSRSNSHITPRMMTPNSLLSPNGASDSSSTCDTEIIPLLIEETGLESSNYGSYGLDMESRKKYQDFSKKRLIFWAGLPTFKYGPIEFLNEEIIDKLIEEGKQVNNFDHLIHALNEVLCDILRLGNSFTIDHSCNGKEAKIKMGELSEAAGTSQDSSKMSTLNKEILRSLEGESEKDIDDSSQNEIQTAATSANIFVDDDPAEASGQDFELDDLLNFDNDQISNSDSSEISKDAILTVDLESLRRVKKKIFDLQNQDINDAINNNLIMLATLIRHQYENLKFRSRILHCTIIAFEIITNTSKSYIDMEFVDRALPKLCFTTTMLPVFISAKLVQIWSVHYKENLRSLIECCQQLITLKVIADEDKVHENLDIISATKMLRIIYYASILAGEYDCPKSYLPKDETKSAAFVVGPVTCGLNDEYRFDDVSLFCHNGKSLLPLQENRLEMLLGLNAIDSRVPYIPFEEFYNEPLSEAIHMDNDYLHYKNLLMDPKSENNNFSFMTCSFILSPTSKVIALSYDSRIRMYSERNSSLFAILNYGQEEVNAKPDLRLKVRRDNIIDDALINLEIIAMANPKDLKKQLVVEFIGEQGVDEGGVSKEFFQLIIDEIFNPDFGMFIHMEETKTMWFNSSPFENEAQFTLIGIILGLAIYNNIILAVHFPQVVYRKLMGGRGIYHDLKDWSPTIYQSLDSMLKYEGDDMADVFMQTFKISYQTVFGEVIDHELKDGGSEIFVEQHNKQEFADLYADFLLNTSIDRQFKAFKKGFDMVTDESPLKLLFRPDEIELLVCGSRKFDFQELEKSTEYEGGYTKDSEIIKDFWSIVHGMSDELKRKLLEFTTGSDRVPVGGFSRLKLLITRNGTDSDRLPTSHTCFNVLLLPEYSSKEKLEDRLLKAINYSKGFGML